MFPSAIFARVVMKGKQSFSPTTIVYSQGGVNIFKSVVANIPPCTHSNPALLKHSSQLYLYSQLHDIIIFLLVCVCDYVIDVK